MAKQEEIDGRSVYVGNVDYQSTPEQLEEFFHGVGVIERVTILFDRFSGLPKGYAYIEFEQTESVQKAIDELHGKEFRGRELRVTAKEPIYLVSEEVEVEVDSEPEEEEEVVSEEEVEAEVVLIPEALEMVTLNKLMVMPRMRKPIKEDLSEKISII